MKKYPLHENNLDILYTNNRERFSCESHKKKKKKLLDYLASIGFYSKPITFWNIGIQPKIDLSVLCDSHVWTNQFQRHPWTDTDS